MEFSRTRAVSDRRRIARALPRTARDQDSSRGPHPHIEPGHRHQPRRLRQAQDQRPGNRTLRNQISERPRPQNCESRCRHRRIGHLAFAKSGRRQRAPRPRRTTGGAQYCLRDAGCAGKRPRALCRQNRRGARRGTLGHRHPHRSRKTRRASAGKPADLAVAGQRSHKGLWRRRQ